ncbi:solute carrier family 49 member 4 homolog [Mercenaria mercenaria]|uniref:solute carrier family 49 member 4 homolog n=1 Tax=Mercenaria mercenaria TaxID=6596 RepID=UPI00234E982F|nr:solute carrier family 49 member 4 homolog [Mercenaria mercenaria]
MENTVDEKRPLTAETRVYGRRYWILTVFCMTCCVQSMIWNTWGPVAESSEIVFGWADGNVALVANLANISYMFLVIPMCMMMDTKGLRFSMILCTGMLVFCSVIRCFSLEPVTATVTAYVCGLIQGIAATMPFSGPPLVAAVWFPPAERPVATAIGSFFNYMGVSLSFIIGPQLVPDPVYQDHVQNSTNTSVTNVTDSVEHKIHPDKNEVVNMGSLRQGILNLLYTHSAFAGLAFILTITYFPSKPPHPPSITASIQRTDYKQALIKILRNGSLWLIVLAGGIPIGVIGVWIAILDVVLKPLGVTQIDAGWMGFWHTLIGCFSGIFIAKFSDLFNRRRKLFLISLFTCAMVCSIWFALLCTSVIVYDLKSLYASCILLGIFINGTTPLFYEICAEASYPVAEGVTGGFYTLVDNVGGVIFLSLVSVPNIGTEWMNWTVLGSLVVAIPMLFVFPERYKRTDIDLNRDVEIHSS